MSLINFLPILITLAGAYFIIKLRFFFLLHPIHTLGMLSGAVRNKSARKSLSLALAGTLGVGNIVGVAYGISVGGAGCIFWILVSSVFAAVIKYAESLIAADTGRSGHGGLMYVIRGAFIKNGKLLAVIYAILCLGLSLTMGSALQVRSALEAAEAVVGISPVLFSVIFTLLVGAVIVGGARKIENVTVFIIPFATIVYILMCIFVIFLNLERLPGVALDIINGAFNFKSAGTGIFTFLFSASLREGYARGLLSNEAGAGTSAMAQTRAEAESPVATGLLGMCEVVFDTVILCTLTGVTVLISGAPLFSGHSGMEIILYTFSSTLGTAFGVVILMLISAFAYSTVVCWYYYGCECIFFLSAKEHRGVFVPLFLLSAMLGALIPSKTLIAVSDYLLFFMSIITTVALIKSSERILHLSEQYGLLKKSKKSDV